MRYFYVIICSLLLAGSALAQEFEFGRRVGLGNTIMLSKPQASEFVSCPVALVQEGTMLFDAGYLREFELADLDNVFASGVYRYNDITFSLGFSQIGRADYYTEQIIRGSVGYIYKDISLALLTSGKLLNISTTAGDIKLSAFGLGLASSLNYGKYHFAFVCKNLNRPTLETGLEGEPRSCDFFAEIEGSKLLSVTGGIFLEENEDPIFSIGQHFSLPGNHALFIGIQSDPIIYGGGLDISYAGFGITYAVNHHTVLGFTHNISLTYLGGEKED